MKIFKEINDLKIDANQLNKTITSLNLEISMLKKFILHNFSCKTKYDAFEKDYIKTMTENAKPTKPPKPFKPPTVHDKPTEAPTDNPYKEVGK